jgi:hypothetical protein
LREIYPFREGFFDISLQFNKDLRVLAHTKGVTGIPAEMLSGQKQAKLLDFKRRCSCCKPRFMRSKYFTEGIYFYSAHTSNVEIHL